jgi:hypothetical protein
MWPLDAGLEPSTLGWLGKCSTTVPHLLENVLQSFLPFYLPVWALEAGLKPSTLRWWGKCSTIVLLLLENVLLSPNVTTRCWTRTLNLIMIRQVLYHCATAPRKCTTIFFTILSPSLSTRVWNQTLNIGMMRQVFYHCATAPGKCSTNFVAILSNLTTSRWTQTLNLGMIRQVFYYCATPPRQFCLPILAVASGLKPFTLGWLGKCSTIVLQLLEIVLQTFLQFHLPNLTTSSWTKTCNIGMMRQVFYYCATATGKCTIKLYLPFDLSIRLLEAGLEPSTWDEASAPPLGYWDWKMYYLILSQFQQHRLESNPWSGDEEASVLPLCSYTVNITSQ